MDSGDQGGRSIVTGGAGAIGSFLVRALLKVGESVTVVDNFSSGRRESLADVSAHPRLRIETADLTQPNGIGDVFRGASSVWHLAANPDIRRGTETPRLDFEHGTLATFHVLEAARTADVRRVYFASSSVVYGRPTIFPTAETYGPLLPQSQYGAAKLAAEGMVSAFAVSYGIRARIFRFANIIGPSMTHGVLYDFVRKLRDDPSHLEVLGDGQQSKSYLRVEDCVVAMLRIAREDGPIVDVFNIGNRDRISVREIAERVVAAAGGTARIEYRGGSTGWVGDVPQQLLAIDRILALGWAPSGTSAEAVDRTIPEVRAELRS